MQLCHRNEWKSRGLCERRQEVDAVQNTQERCKCMSGRLRPAPSEVYWYLTKEMVPSQWLFQLNASTAYENIVDGTFIVDFVNIK